MPSASRARPWPCSSGPSTCACPTARTGRAWCTRWRRRSRGPSAAPTPRPPSCWPPTLWPATTRHQVCSGEKRCRCSPPWPRTPSTTDADAPGDRPRFGAAVLTAMPMELAPVRRRMSDAQPFPVLGGRAVTGRLGGVHVVATTVGVGTRAAMETAERVLQSVSVPLVVVVGVAGASAPHLKVADVVVPEKAVHGPGGTTHTSTTSVAALDRKGTIHTHDELIIDAEEVRVLHRRGIVAMDMETGSIAAVCERHGVEWTAFRAMSDTPEQPVDPASMSMLNKDGTPNVGASLRFMVRNPHRIPRLVAMGRDTAKACNAAAAA